MLVILASSLQNILNPTSSRVMSCKKWFANHSWVILVLSFTVEKFVVIPRLLCAAVVYRVVGCFQEVEARNVTSRIFPRK